jgi:hypothetical protein
MSRGKIVIYKDGSYLYAKDGITWEYENDPDWLASIGISDEELAKLATPELIDKALEK